MQMTSPLSEQIDQIEQAHQTAIHISAAGGPEVLVPRQVPIP